MKFLYTDENFYNGNFFGLQAVNVDEIQGFYITRHGDDDTYDVVAKIKGSRHQFVVRSIFTGKTDAYLYICRVVNAINKPPHDYNAD